MHGSTAVWALCFVLVPTWVLASDRGTDSPKVAKSVASAIRIENVRIVGAHVFRAPDASSDTGYINPGGATISFDLVNRGEAEIAVSQLEERVLVQQWIEPANAPPIGCVLRAGQAGDERMPAGGWTLGPGIVRFPPTMKAGASVGVELPLYPIAAYRLHGRYSYYLCLQSKDGSVWDEHRITIEAWCPDNQCWVHQLPRAARKPR